MKMTRKDFLKSMGIGLLGSALPTQNVFAKKKKTNFKSNIMNFGAKANGKSDDSKALLKAIKKYGECYLPKRRRPYILGNINLNGAKIFGGGEIKKLSGAPFIFQFQGIGNSLEGLRFNSIEKYDNTITEISLGENLRGLKVLNCFFHSSIYSAISADKNGKDDSSLTYKTPAKGIQISQCHFDGKYSRPLYLHSVEDISIIGNHFSNTLFDAIRLRQKVGKAIISKNNFTNIGTLKSNDSQDAIDTYWSGKELIISENIIEGCAKHGLDIKGHSPSGEYGSNDILISNNLIKESEYCGISLSAGRKLKDQKFRPLENIIISQNIIKGSNSKKLPPGSAGILLRHGLKEVSIIGNQISKNNCRGIFVNNFEKDAPINESISILNNQCNDNGLNSDGHGILASSVKDLIIQGNTCNNNLIVGIAVTDDLKRGFMATEGIISGNICRGNKKAQIIAPKSRSKLLQKENLTS